MSPGFVKGLLLTSVVFGLEGVVLGGVGFIFGRDTRRAVGLLVRSGITVIVFSCAFLLFRRGYFRDDFSLLFLFMGCMGLSIVVAKNLARTLGRERAIDQIPNDERQHKHITKRQFVLLVTLGFAWALVTPAIVFTIVAPEVLAVYWWLVLIVTAALLGFVVASRFWWARERAATSAVREQL
jgi:hypothetical protein